MADDIVTRLYNATPYGLEDSTLLIDARAEIERLRALCSEAQEFIKHDTNCGAVTDWGKNCSCGYDEMWRKLDSLEEAHRG